jgi:hypothetical protein
MKRTVSVKKILKMIFNIILLLSLTGCASCSMEEAFTIHIQNSSSKSVTVTFIASGNNQAPKVMAPGSFESFQTNSRSYGISVRINDNWLAWAKGRRAKLIELLNANFRDANKKLTQQEVNEFKTEVDDITRKIDTYVPSSEKKGCSGMVKGDSAGVGIYDGETSGTINVSCS